MDQSTLDRLEDMALSIEKLRHLDDRELEWLYLMLTNSIKLTLKMLDLISEGWMSYYDIATELGVNHQTVSQRIHALARGGMAIEMDKFGAIAKTGRPRQLLTREEK